MYLLKTRKSDIASFRQLLPTSLHADYVAAHRAPEGFPLLLDSDGAVQWACLSFLIGKYRLDNTRDRQRTLQTYAEGLKDWLGYLKATGHEWVAPPPVALSDFRRAIAEGVERRKPGARATINLRTTIVREFYTFLANWTSWHHHYASIVIDPVPINRFLRAAAGLKVVRAYERAPRSLSVGEIERIYSKLDFPYSLIFRWSLATGLRRSSVTSLTIHQLPENVEMIGYVAITVKGGKKIEVPVTSSLVRRTWEYVSTIRALALARSGVPTDRVFVNRSGMSVTSRAYYEAFRRAAKAAGIKASPHCTRHTFAVHMCAALERVASGGANVNPVKVIQHILGHSNSATTELYLESISAADVDTLRVLLEAQEVLS